MYNMACEDKNTVIHGALVYCHYYYYHKSCQMPDCKDDGELCGDVVEGVKLGAVWYQL